MFRIFFFIFSIYILQYFLLNESVVSWAKQKIFFLPKKMRLFAELHFCPNVFNKRKGINELLIKQRRSLFTLIWRILDKGEGGDICKPFLACPIIHHLFRVCMRGSVLHTSNRSFWRQQHKRTFLLKNSI
jgi:hypothetical protein